MSDSHKDELKENYLFWHSLDFSRKKIQVFRGNLVFSIQSYLRKSNSLCHSVVSLCLLPVVPSHSVLRNSKKNLVYKF